jgi:hypothetical protein
MTSIAQLREVYDYRSVKSQNFAFKFKITDIVHNESKIIEVYASSMTVAKDRLLNEIGRQFQISEQ